MFQSIPIEFENVQNSSLLRDAVFIGRPPISIDDVFMQFEFEFKEEIQTRQKLACIFQLFMIIVKKEDTLINRMPITSGADE